MKKVALSIIHNRMHRGTSQKAVSVELRFTCERNRKYVSTGIKVCPHQWAEKKKCIIRHEKSEELNDLLAVFVKRAEKVVEKMNEENLYDLNLVVPLMEGADRLHSFVEYCEKRAEERKVHEHTKERYRVFIRFMREWGKIVTFTDCNAANIRAMDEFLHRQGKAQSTIYDYHKFLKLFINDAVIDGYIQENPYKRLTFKIGRGTKQYVDCITEEQFNAIKALELTNKHLLNVRDLFLFQCYTGLAYSDLMAFDYSNCEEVNGKWFYHAKRTKTDTDFVFQLLTPAVNLLISYKFRLPHISNQKYNDYLKAIGHMVGIDGLHSHMGRATAATLFLSKGMPINVVSKVLGHTSLRQTTRYARTLNKDVCSAFDNLEGKM